MNWGEAKGHETDDWYLPSVYELQTMYNTIGQGADIPYYNIGDFASGSIGHLLLLAQVTT